MNFDLSEDQAMLRDTARRLFADASVTPGGLWVRMAELGLLAAPFAEAHGGLELGAVETMILGESSGHAQALSAYGTAVIAAGTALRLAPEPPSDRIAALATGTESVAWAHEETGLTEIAPRLTAVCAVGDGWIVTGRKTNVAHAERADRLVTTGVIDGTPALFVVSTSIKGVSRRDYALFDGTPASDLVFEDAAVEALLATGENAAGLTERAREHYVGWRAAEATGLMQAALNATLDHLKTRRQFGQTLSSFQALRHKAAEMLIALEQARSMAMFAALSVDNPDPAARRKAIAQVRGVIGRSSRLVAQTAVQLHGGIGVTEEHPVGRAFRRLTMIDLEMERG